jgi:hypothetical protein
MGQLLPLMGRASMEHHRKERESRSPVWVKVVVRQPGKADLAAIVTNISDNGCCVRASEELLAGTKVTLLVPRLGALGARVRWVKGRKAGLQFEPKSSRFLYPTVPDRSHVTSPQTDR